MTTLHDVEHRAPSAPSAQVRAGRRRVRPRRIALVAVLVVVSAVVLLPFIWMLSASVRSQGDIIGHPSTLWPAHFTWKNYTDIWTRIPFARQFLNTVVYSCAVTALSVTFDSMAGYAFARFQFPGQRIVFVLVILTMMLPFQVTLVPIFRLLSDLHWINTYQGLVLPRAADAFGIFFMRQFFIAIPADLEDAARIDGAGELRIWWQVMMPLAVPAVLTLGLFNLLANWNDLLWPLIVTTDTSMQTLPAGLALFKGQHVTEYGLLMAGAVLTLLPMVVAFLLVQRRFIEGIATTGVK